MRVLLVMHCPGIEYHIARYLRIADIVVIQRLLPEHEASHSTILRCELYSNDAALAQTAYDQRLGWPEIYVPSRGRIHLEAIGGAEAVLKHLAHLYPGLKALNCDAIAAPI